MKRRLEFEETPLLKRRKWERDRKRKQHFDHPPAKRARQDENDVLRRQLVEAYTKIDQLEQRIKELEYIANLNRQQIMHPYIPSIECY